MLSRAFFASLNRARTPKVFVLRLNSLVTSSSSMHRSWKSSALSKGNCLAGFRSTPKSSTSSRFLAALKRDVRSSVRCFSSNGGSGGPPPSTGGGGGGGGDGKARGGLWGLWMGYLKLLETKPLGTKTVTSGALNGLGDLICQLFVEDGKELDWKRLGIFSLVGLVLIGPALHVWYGLLSAWLPAQSTPAALGRVFLDQFVFAPFFIATIVGSITTLEGHPEEVVPKWKKDLFVILKTNWYIWIPFQFFNFRVVPLQLQVMASNLMAIAWNTYMSYASHT